MKILINKTHIMWHTKLLFYRVSAFRKYIMFQGFQSVFMCKMCIFAWVHKI